MRRRAAGELDKDLAIVEDEAERCRQVVEGLLDLTRPQMIDPVEVDLHALAEDAATPVIASSGPTTMRLSVEGSATVRGSDAKLRQVMTNLVKNGLDAAGPGGGLRVEIHQY